MAVTIDATVGGASANSYVPLADFTTYAESRQPSTAFDDATTDEKNRALVSAARRLDQENYHGVRVNETQALQWPRYGVEKPDVAYSVLDGPMSMESTWYDTDEIPQRIKDAQMELAYQILAGNSTPDDTGLEQFQEVTVGSLAVTPRAGFRAGKLPEVVLRWIRPLLRTSENGVRLVRG